VDFIVQNGDKNLPIEVKSGLSKNKKSLLSYGKIFHAKFAEQCFAKHAKWKERCNFFAHCVFNFAVFA